MPWGGKGDKGKLGGPGALLGQILGIFGVRYVDYCPMLMVHPKRRL